MDHLCFLVLKLYGQLQERISYSVIKVSLESQLELFLPIIILYGRDPNVVDKFFTKDSRQKQNFQINSAVNNAINSSF